MPRVSTSLAPSQLLKAVTVENEMLTEPFHLEVDLTGMTGSAYADAAAAGKDLDLPATAALLADVVRSWDLEDDDGQVLPISTDRILRLPVAIIGMMAGAVMDAYQPGEASGGSFAAG